ncbi:MAG: type I-C CRISPR-associated protein Cas8c/Csd1, partial [Eubacteriales bacterium]
MGLFQQAMLTYDNLSEKVGVLQEGKKEPLCPIAHIIAKAQIEVTITKEGNFVDAKIVDKDNEKTVIPATESSASRSSGIAPHILSDQLGYLTKIVQNEKKNKESKFEVYMNQLKDYMEFENAHEKVVSIYQYMKKECLLEDLIASEILKKDDKGKLQGKINGVEYEKCMVRWVVFSDEDKMHEECYRDSTLFENWQKYVLNKNEIVDLCILTGEQTVITQNHSKGVIAKDNGAKLLSANDTTGFTYRGRFTKVDQLPNIGFEVSQKAHLALRYLIANDGCYMGDSKSGRTFLWWNPKGKELIKFDEFGFQSKEETAEMSYKEQLFQTLTGYQKRFAVEDDVIVASFEAATTGRLAITYYSELKANDFFERVTNWYDEIILSERYIPTFKNIVEYAFGRENEKGWFAVDGNVLKKESQVLIQCMLEGRKIPIYYVKKLAGRATKQVLYDKKNRNRILITTCAVIRKYYNNQLEKEEFKLNLQENSTDRSYLFGRYLALAENIEYQSYSRDEKGKRDPNALRMQAAFAQKPFTTFRILEERLLPYKNKLSEGSKVYYKNLIQSIICQLDMASMDELNKP